MKKNCREDFAVIETFKTIDGEGNAVRALVPNRVRVEYYVKDRFKSVLCERNGDHFKGCRLVDDGFGLECAIPLFVHGGIGLGLLKHRVTIILNNRVFPVSEQYIPVPEVVTLEDGSHIQLVEGPGDPELSSIPDDVRPVILVPGDRGPQGGVIWPEMYVDEDLYLHIVEPEHQLADRISFDQSTGLVEII